MAFRHLVRIADVAKADAVKRSPIKRRRRTKHQLRNLEHRDYLAWVVTQPCAACGTRQNIQAAHVGRGGMGMKHGSDAEVIPLCGPHWIFTGPGACDTALALGCHADHDQCAGQFRLMTRAHRRAWDATQVAAHRGRFEARGVGAQTVPF